MKNILAILKRELLTHLYAPSSYIIALVFVLLWEYLFFQNVFLIGEASLRPLFAILPWFLLFLVPAVGMSTIAEEKNRDTLELVLTHPVSNRQFVIGKYLSVLSYTAFLLLACIPIAFSLGAYGNMDYGVIVGQYLAALLLASVISALGVSVSSFFKSQVPALLVSVVATFLLIIIGWDIVTINIPLWLGEIFSRISLLTHFNSLARGVIDIRDIWYFGLLTVIFLEIAVYSLSRFRGEKKSVKNMWQNYIIPALAIVFILTSLLNYMPKVQLDLTSGHIYTLSRATKDIVKNLDQAVDITVYVSKDLPAGYQPTEQTVKDILQDYKRYASSNLTITYKDPTTAVDIAKEAAQNGINAVQFNVVGNSELKVKKGYFGLVVTVNDKHRSIPFIKKTDDLEYQLTSDIRELTIINKKKLVLIGDTGQSRNFQNELRKNYDVTVIDLTKESLPTSTSAVIMIDAGSGLSDDAGTKLATYLQQGGSALILTDPIMVNPQYFSVIPNGTSTQTFLDTYGIHVNNNLVYDWRANQNVTIGSGFINYVVPYPLFPTLLVPPESIFGSQVHNAVTPWAGSLTMNNDVLDKKGLSYEPILVTSKYAGVATNTSAINPQTQWSKNNLSSQVIGVRVFGKDTDAQTDTNQSMKLAVIGDTDLIADTYLSNFPANGVLLGEVTAWLAQDTSLAGLKIKQNIPRPLNFRDNTEMMWVKFGNLFGVFILLTVFGVVLINRRRVLRKRSYGE